jgi:hypothetical protein
MGKKENQLWESLKEWSIQVPRKWWDMLNVPLTYIPFAVGITFVLLWLGNVNPPIPLWIMIIIPFGAILFIIVSFLAFHRVKLERDEARKAKGKIAPPTNREELLRTIAEAGTATIKTLEIVEGVKEWGKQNPSIMNIEALKLVETTKQRQRNAYESYEKEILVAGSDWEPILKALKINMQISWIFIASMHRWKMRTARLIIRAV